MDRLILVRHGETDWNARKVLQGQADIELSARGRGQAEALKRLVQRWQPTSAVCSDLSRTVETACLLGWANARRDVRWREADLGEWTGRQVAELRRDTPMHYQRWRDGLEAPPEGETFTCLRERVAAAVQALASTPGNVLVVAHGGVIRAALSTLIGLHAERIVPVEPASATVFQMAPTARLLAYNVTAHDVESETPD